MPKKTTVSCYIASFTMSRINKIKLSRKSRQQCREIRTLMHSWKQCKLVQPPWNIVQRLFKNLEIEQECNSEILLLTVNSKEMKSYQSNTHSSMSVAAVFTVEEIQNQLKCPFINEHMRKICYTHNTVLFSCQEE